jgi:hypothetical protein
MYNDCTVTCLKLIDNSSESTYDLKEFNTRQLVNSHAGWFGVHLSTM